MQEQAVRVICPGFFNEDEEEWDEDEEEFEKEEEEWDGEENGKDVLAEDEENMQGMIKNVTSETKMRLLIVASVICKFRN